MPPYSQESSMAQQPLPAPKPPSQREVATGVVNLGNTCYMNAVLQALAHAPELCLAMDCEPHSASCPIAKANAKRGSRSSPSPDAFNSSARRTTRKSRRSNSGKKSPSPGADAEEGAFCALCEVEHHLQEVHSTAEPVAPSAFVNGFIDHVAPWFKLGVQEDSHEFLRLLIDAMQKSCARARASEQEDTEYPFQLFRGTVESNVQCESCQASSSKIDPIEDIGLEVSAKTGHGTSTPPPNSLADVSSAFSRFARAEILDGYKCDNCGKIGKATKQSRLASIPPILTLHLKRFRYGTSTEEQVAARRRSEISQLLSRDASTTGKSGSAKIEGHVQFEQIFDLRPFLTPALQQSHKSMFCRLFAVIVHAGTNSHSGHYIAYVRNLARNEWWKMDDARVTRATSQEVMAAEAYMLFYRVVEHPIAVQLREQHKAQAANKAYATSTASVVDKTNISAAVAAESTESTTGEVIKQSSDKKRKRPMFPTGEDWARAKTRMPPSLMSVFRRAEAFVSENVEFNQEYFSEIFEEASKGGAVPTTLCADDVQGGTDRFRSGLLDLIFKLWKEGGDAKAKFFQDQDTSKKGDTSNTDKKSTLIVPLLDADETFPLL